MGRFVALAGIGYAVVIGILTFGLFRARESARAEFSSSDARQAWETWRNETQSPEAPNLPVRRSVPRSTEPPTLVLLRDHFVVCLVATLTLSSVLYWTAAFFLRGIVSGPQFVVEHRDT